MKPSEILREMRKNPTKNTGICRSYFIMQWDTFGSQSDSLSDLKADMSAYEISFKDWPEFSGVRSYPIKGKHADPVAAFGSCQHYWSKRTKYGQARWRLLDWLIEQFEAKGA